MEQIPTKKILICGDVEGNLELQAKRSKDFDMTLCVGELLSWRVKIDELKEKYYNEQLFKKPIYFVETGPLANVLCTVYPDGYEILPNLHFLGKFGVKKINGFNICYLSGIHNSTKEKVSDPMDDEILASSGYYSEKDFYEIINKLKNDETFKGIDFQLTSRWPKNFEKHTYVDDDIRAKSLKIVSLLAYHMKPRYHFVAYEDKYFQRHPYKNYLPISHKQIHISRLIALASFPEINATSTQKKDKYQYAIKTEPQETMDETTLYSITEDTTENPYLSIVDPNSKDEEFSDKFNNRNYLSKRGEGQFEEDSKKEFDEMFNKKIEEMKENTVLHISGFDSNKSNVADIEEFLDRIGKVESFHLTYHTDRNAKSTRKKFREHMGYGFVKFKNIETTKKCLRTSGTLKLEGCKVMFNFSKFDKNDATTHRQNDANCWFCLGNENVRKEQIFYIGGTNYLCLDYGPIEKYHFLLVPIDHLNSYIDLKQEQKNDIIKCEKRLFNFYEGMKRGVIKFERYNSLSQNVNHMFNNYVSFNVKDFSQIVDRFEKTVLKTKMDFFQLKEDEKLENFVQVGEKQNETGENTDAIKAENYYIYIEFWNTYSHKKLKFLCLLSEHLTKGLPMDFMRNLICEITCDMSKKNWKDCIVDADEQSILTKQLRHEFQSEK